MRHVRQVARGSREIAIDHAPVSSTRLAASGLRHPNTGRPNESGIIDNRDVRPLDQFVSRNDLETAGETEFAGTFTKMSNIDFRSRRQEQSEVHPSQDQVGALNRRRVRSVNFDVVVHSFVYEARLGPRHPPYAIRARQLSR